MTSRSFRQRRVALHLTQESKKNYLVLLLAFFSLFLFGFWGIRPLLSSIVPLRSELRSGKIYEVALTEKITALDEGKTDLAQITTKLEAIDNAVPNEPSQADLIEELMIDGGRTGFSFTAIHFGERETENGVSFEHFECTFKGSPTALIRFLKEVEKGRLVKITSLKYKREGTKVGSALTVTISGKSFYYERGQE